MLSTKERELEDFTAEVDQALARIRNRYQEVFPDRDIRGIFNNKGNGVGAPDPARDAEPESALIAVALTFDQMLKKAQNPNEDETVDSDFNTSFITIDNISGTDFSSAVFDPIISSGEGSLATMFDTLADPNDKEFLSILADGGVRVVYNDPTTFPTETNGSLIDVVDV